MNLETRNAKSETQTRHPALSPAELSALLGPCMPQTIEPVVNVSVTCASQWTAFAEAIAQDLTARLRPLIRAAVRVTFLDSRTLTAETLAAGSENRDVARFWQSTHSVEPIAVVLSAPLVATFVDRLLGGHSTPTADESHLHRPLTEVDQRFASRLSDAVRQSVNNQDKIEPPLELTELSGHSNSLVEAWLPDSSLLQLSFDLRFVQGGGSLDLLIPMEIADSLADQAEVLEVAVESSPSVTAEMPNRTARRSTVAARLGQTALSQSDLQSLAVGDVLLMPTIADQTVQVLVDGQPQFEGIAGTIEGHKAIRLTKSVSARAS